MHIYASENNGSHKLKLWFFFALNLIVDDHFYLLLYMDLWNKHIFYCCTFLNICWVTSILLYSQGETRWAYKTGRARAARHGVHVVA